ncbi:MAG: hypothetical protein PHC66_03090, partial [Candidatus Nanoarchaeia archaeon]|nr:hypothetical protein [Candidatus Nanoarchaeia archaeon]
MPEPENSVIGEYNNPNTPKKSRSHLDILKIMLVEPNKEHTLNEIQEKLSISYEPAYRYMQELIEKNYVSQRVSAHNKRFFSVNLKNSVVLNEVDCAKMPKTPVFSLSEPPKKDSKLLMYASLILILCAALSPIFIMTGMFSGQEHQYKEELQLTFSSDEYNYSWDMQNYNENTTLKSVMISGYTIGEGNTTMYLEDNSGNRLLILDTSELASTKKSGITAYAIKGRAIAEETGTPSETIEISSPEQTPVEEAPAQETVSENTTEEAQQEVIYKSFNFLCDETCMLDEYSLNQSSYTLYFVSTGNVSVTITEIDYTLIENQNITEEISNESETNETLNQTPPENVTLSNYTIINANGEVVHATMLFTPKAQEDVFGTSSVQSFEIASEEGANETIPTGIYEVTVELQEGPITGIIIHDMIVSENQTGFIKVDDTPESEGSVETYAIDPTAINFTSADVTVTAKGNALYKCANWSFEGQACNGKWILAQKINSGKEYTFELTAEDPAFKEIYVLSAEHLDADKNFVSDIFNETITRDFIWSEPIYHNEYVRVYFDDDMTNGNVINLYPRNMQGLNTKVEIYDETGSVRVGEITVTTDMQYNIEISGMTGYSDTFLLKIVNADNNPGAYIEFDYIHDSNWLVPTSWTADGNWTKGQKAYDDNTGTYASDASGSSIATWGSFITFNLSQNITSDKVRVYADYGYGYTDAVQVDVFDANSNSWVTIRNGSMLDSTWDEMGYGTDITVNAARFRWHYSASGTVFWLYEFQFSNKSASYLPVVTTNNATSVGKTSAVMHGTLASDGGEVCDVRFEYGLTTSYGNTTAWLSDRRSTGSNFTYILSGLEFNTTYYYRAQANNSKGIANGSYVEFTTRIPDYGWLSPNGYSDPNNEWTWEERAYDDVLDSESKAKSYHNLNDADGNWSFPIILNITPSINSDMLRFYAKGVDMDMVNISVFKDNAWELVYSGAYNDLVWNELNFTAGNLSAAKFEFKIVNNGNGEYWELYDVDFFNTPVSVILNETVENSKKEPINHTLKLIDKKGDVVYNDTGVSHSKKIKKGTYDIVVEPVNSTIKQIVFDDVNIDTNITNIVNIDEPANNGEAIQTYAIDPTAINFTIANVTVTAKGNILQKCKDWNFTNQTCEGEWITIKSITPGELYNVTLTPEDPGFAEIVSQNSSKDLDTTPIDNTTFVMAYVADTNIAYFKVYNTNGTVISNGIIDSANLPLYPRIAVSAINQTHFVVAWTNDHDTAANICNITLAIYNISGAKLTSDIIVDDNIAAATGDSHITDLSATQMGNRFVVGWSDDSEGDASFKIFDNAGTNLTGIIDVDPTVATPSALVDF